MEIRTKKGQRKQNQLNFSLENFCLHNEFPQILPNFSQEALGKSWPKNFHFLTFFDTFLTPTIFYVKMTAHIKSWFFDTNSKTYLMKVEWFDARTFEDEFASDFEDDWQDLMEIWTPFSFD